MGVKKNFLYSSILTTSNYLFPLITYPYVSRVLGVTNIGICNFVDSIVHYFILCSVMGIGVVGIREVANSKNDRQKLNRVFSCLFWLNTITTSIALVVLLFVTFYIDQLRVHWQMMAVGSLKLVMNYLLIEWLYKGLEEFKFITLRSLVVKTLYVISIFIFVRSADDYLIYYLLSTLMIAFNAIINIVYSRKYVSIKIRGVNFSQYLHPFFILGIYTLLTSMYTTFNVVYLGFACSETEVGYYTTAVKIFGLLIAIYTAFTGVMLPRMSALLSEGKIKEFKLLLSKSNTLLFSFSIPIIFFSVVFAPLIVDVIAGAGYEGAILPMRIVMPLMLIIGYEQIIIIQALMPLKEDREILINSLIGALIGIIMNILLVSSFKSVGSSLVWVISEITVLCLAQHCVYKHIGNSFPWKEIIKNLIINIPLLLILVLLNTICNNSFFLFGYASTITIIYFLAVHLFVTKNEVLLNAFNSLTKSL